MLFQRFISEMSDYSLEYRGGKENASSPPIPPTTDRIDLYPVYVGPIFEDCQIKLNIDGMYQEYYIWSVLKDSKEYVFDLVQKNNLKEYEERLVGAKDYVNSNRPHLLDLPMMKISDTGELLQAQKVFYSMGCKGVLYFYAYSKPDEKDLTKRSFKTLLFNRRDNQ